MRRIELRPDIHVPNDQGSVTAIPHAKYLSDLVRADASFGLWPKTAIGVSILGKIANAKGHVFFDDAEYVALLAALHGVPTLTVVAFPATDAGWQVAVENAEEWIEKDGQLVRKE